MIISTIKKIDKGYEVSIDEKTYLLDEETILKYRLYSGKEVKEEEVELFIKDSGIEQIKKKALAYQMRYLKSSRETMEYLIKKEIDASLAQEAISSLIEQGLIRDIQIAGAMAASYARGSNGPRMIRQKLILHQFSENVIETALKNISKEDIEEGKEKLLKKSQKKLVKYSDFEKRQRLKQIFYQRGYFSMED